MKKLFIFGAIGALIEASPIMGVVMAVMCLVFGFAILSHYLSSPMTYVVWAFPLIVPVAAILVLGYLLYRLVVATNKKESVLFLLWWPVATWVVIVVATLVCMFILTGYEVAHDSENDRRECAEVIGNLPQGERFCTEYGRGLDPPFAHFQP